MVPRAAGSLLKKRVSGYVPTSTTAVQLYSSVVLLVGILECVRNLHSCTLVQTYLLAVYTAVLVQLYDE